jgi:hypothetical protein
LAPAQTRVTEAKGRGDGKKDETGPTRAGREARGKDEPAAKKAATASRDQVAEKERAKEEFARRSMPGDGRRRVTDNRNERPAPAARSAASVRGAVSRELGGGAWLGAELNKGMNAGGGKGDVLGTFRANTEALLPAPPLMVREFAHVRTASKGDLGQDAADTIYWHPVLVLPEGKGTSKFDLPDSVTTYRILVAGHTADGRLGSATREIAVRRP